MPHSDFETVLATFPAPVKAMLRKIPASQGKLAGTDVAEMQQLLGAASLFEVMAALLPFAQTFARVPVSNFRVGAVSAGLPAGSNPPALYFGANVEFATEALSCTVHAEQSATNTAWLHGELGLSALAISAAPCGYCRQFLYELVTAQTLEIVLPQKGAPAPAAKPLTFYVPDAFGPHDLGVNGGLMQKQPANGLVLTTSDPLVQAALSAANSCYAPYTKNFSGVALLASSGEVFTGQYAENAAYNPSLSPLQSAVAFMNVSSAPGSSLSITRAVLVEVPTLASQLAATTVGLASFAPGVALEYYVGSTA